jgi:hypothetical protein
MMGENVTKVRDTLDHIRRKQPKFVCINDDVKSDDPDPALFTTLRSFFVSFFPVPSPYELPPHRYHQLGHLDDIMAARAERNWALGKQAAMLVAGALLVCLALCRLCCPRGVTRDSSKMLVV